MTITTTDRQRAADALAVLTDLPGIVRREISARGVTQTQAGDEMGMTSGALSNVLQGKTKSGRSSGRDGITLATLTVLLQWVADVRPCAWCGTPIGPDESRVTQPHGAVFHPGCTPTDWTAPGEGPS